MVLVNGRIFNGCFHAAGPLDGRRFNHLVRTQAKHARKRVRDAVALSSTHFTNHRSKITCQHHLGSDSVFVRNNSFEVECDPVIVIPRVEPENVVIPVVGGVVSVAVARIDVNRTISVHVTQREAVHGITG